MDTPKVFLSYSKGKSANITITDIIIKAIKNSLEENGVRVIDPMEESPDELSMVLDSVVSSIFESDAVFVLEFPSVPNTSFEAGVAYALGIPTYLFVPESIGAEHRPSLITYLSYLGHQDGKVNLPSDQVGRKYISIPGDLTQKKVQEQFKKQVKELINQIKKSSISPHVLVPRRKLRKLILKSKGIMGDCSKSEPLSWIISGLLDHHENHLSYTPTSSNKKFLIDDSCYPFFLNTLDKFASDRVIAVADIDSNIEKFWFKNIASHKVKTRIFRLPWTSFYSDSELERFLGMAKELCESYEVYVTDSDSRPEYLQRLATGVSGNYIVFDNVVGYYNGGDKEERKLVFEVNEYLSDSLKLEFNKTLFKSIKITSEIKPTEVREAWIQKRGIGKWLSQYTGGSERNSEYYTNYDKHIRVWIPQYDDFIQETSKKILEFIIKRTPNKQLQIVEIGTGTGALTKPIAAWHSSLKKNGLEPFRNYICVDTSSEMCNSMKKMLNVEHDANIFRVVRNQDFEALKNIQYIEDYDIICGSLILHYIIDNPVDSASWSDFFSELKRYLAPGGMAIFAGCFFDENPHRKESQLKYWRKKMTESGLHESDIKQFIDRNTEMCSMPSPRQISEYAKGTFKTEYTNLFDKNNPFGLIAFKREITRPSNS